MNQIKYIYHPDFDDPVASKKINEYDPTSDPEAFININSKTYNSTQLPKEFIQAVRNNRVLHKSAETMLFKQYNYLKYRYATTGKSMLLERAIQTKSIIADHNYRLIMKMVIKILYSRHKDANELLSDCNYWLLGCIESFNVEFNIKFSTYLCNSLWMNASRRGKKVVQAKSLSVTVDQDGNISELDPYSITYNNEPSHELSMKESAIVLHKVLRTALNQREFDIIVARYGINGKPPMTLKEVGDQFQINRERVRQIQAVAERKLAGHSELLTNLEFV